MPTVTSVANPVSSSGITTFGGSGNTGTSRTLTPNEKLQNGRYVIEKILGQGGMGAALLAKDSRVSNKLVVIKELISDNTDPEKRKEDVRNFEREVETVASIDHPLVPNVTDYFQEGTRAFMVQEYVAGENLEDRMERVNAPMSEREALGYMSQVLDILDYLEHQTPPIVHRDIKPANIIVGAKDKRAHLVDFGIARADENKNAKRKQTSALGTPGYAPPEQYQGNADGRSDLYALAATVHHLVTNRDPRNYPPFAYPSARSLNSKLSPALDGILTKALNIDANKRYQTAADMKRDVDNILAHSFNTAGDTSSYVLGTSGPIATPPQVAPRPQPKPYPQQQPQPARPAVQPRQQPQPARPFVAPPQQQAGMYGTRPAQQPKRNNNGLIRNLGVLLLVVAVIALLLFTLPNLLRGNNSTTTGSTGTNGNTPTTTTQTFTPPASGIGVQPYGPTNDSIGISDGSFAFDTSGAGGTYKTQAANSFKSDPQGAVSEYRQAIATDSKDAESAIYVEDQRAVSSGKYVTFVVATMLSSDNIGVGRDDLQGAYVAQKEYNDNATLNGGMKVRLLIASSGSKADYANLVAQQIVQLAKSDKTFLGVMGWPFSTRTQVAYQTLENAQIPMVSQTASADSLSGASPYFFRVAPSNKIQGIQGAKYAETKLNAKKVVVFFDPSDTYSQSLASDFTQQFRSDGNQVIKSEQYKVNQTGNFPQLLTDALNQKPDLIYFSGYAADVSTLIATLPANNTTNILGGDALYQLGGYSASSKANFKFLKFSTFFYPDIWGIIGSNVKPPKFFNDYTSYFSGTGKGYGYDRVDNDVALSYDATIALLTAYNIAAPSGGTITPDQLKAGLVKTSFQGVSGQIQFDSNGDPIDKSIVILQVDAQGRIGLDRQLGKFFK
jgi:serine/threonine protein kinase/ABC-type branched-subunit amino acid transport system substrate-binding protein